MDGAKLKRLLLDALDQQDASDLYANDRQIYDALDWAAALFIRETMILHSEAVITTVADQQEYDLPPDFIRLYMENKKGRFFAKYYDGTNYSFPYLTTYEKLYKRNLTTAQAYPNHFAIKDKESKESLIMSTATAAGAAQYGQCTLTDSTKLFLTTNRVYARDIIHNESDSSDGIVLSVTSATALLTALFGGTNNQWASGNAYVIQPASEKVIFLDAPSENAGHTIYLPYICMPSPVYSDHGFWRIHPQSCRAIAYGAGSLIKLGHREFVESGQIGGLFADEISRIKRERAHNVLLDRSRYRRVS